METRSGNDLPETIPRVPVSHVMNWVLAIQGAAEPQSHFEQACPLSEMMALGLVAAQVGSAREILYDAENMRITNIPEANQLLKPNYRTGWEL